MESEYSSSSFGGNGAGDDDDDDGPAFIGFDVSGAPPPPKDAFAFTSPLHSEDEDDDDQDYMRRAQRTLESILDEADAALFGETGPCSGPSDVSHVVECCEWQRSLGCFRVSGKAVASGGSAPPSGCDGGSGSDGDYDSESESDGGRMSDITPTHARPVSPSEHCTLPVALAASSLDLCAIGVALSPQLPSEAAVAAGVCEEVLAAHGTLRESIASHREWPRHDLFGLPNARRRDRSRGGKRSEDWLSRRLGLPPRTPALSIIDGVVHALVQRLWRTVVAPRLAAVPFAVARALLGLPQSPQSPPRPPLRPPDARPPIQGAAPMWPSSLPPRWSPQQTVAQPPSPLRHHSSPLLPPPALPVPLPAQQLMLPMPMRCCPGTGPAVVAVPRQPTLAGALVYQANYLHQPPTPMPPPPPQPPPSQPTPSPSNEALGSQALPHLPRAASRPLAPTVGTAAGGPRAAAPAPAAAGGGGQIMFAPAPTFEPPRGRGGVGRASVGGMAGGLRRAQSAATPGGFGGRARGNSAKPEPANARARAHPKSAATQRQPSLDSAVAAPAAAGGVPRVVRLPSINCRGRRVTSVVEQGAGTRT